MNAAEEEVNEVVGEEVDSENDYDYENGDSDNATVPGEALMQNGGTKTSSFDFENGIKLVDLEEAREMSENGKVHEMDDEVLNSEVNEREITEKAEEVIVVDTDILNNCLNRTCY